MRFKNEHFDSVVRTYTAANDSVDTHTSEPVRAQPELAPKQKKIFLFLLLTF
jgi:hypothetical protein